MGGWVGGWEDMGWVGETGAVMALEDGEGVACVDLWVGG